MKNVIKLTLSLLIVIGLSVNTVYSLDKNGTTGKITGKVIDAKDKGPLIGATIKVTGTNLGAISDDNGDYTILNVDVGSYTVTASYIGYDPQSIPDVKVSADLTTQVNFSLKLSGSGIVTEEIEIVGKRNAISPDQSGKIIGQEFIDNSGLRGIENIASTTAGVVQDERGNNINVRGGRTNETAVIIDGVLTTNPLDGTSTAFVSNSVLEELSVLTGGFSAEYGNVLSGVINVTTKGGTDKYSGSLEVISDEFLSNDVSQGYNVYNMSLGGPLIPSKEYSRFINFYAGFERNWSLVNNPSWVADQLQLSNNVLPDYRLGRWSGNAKLNFDLQEVNKKLPVQLKFGTSHAYTDRLGWIQSYMLYNSHRNPLIQEDSYQYYGKINHQISSKMFYELQFNYFDAKYEEGDPQFGGDFYSYGDPSKVAGLTTPGGSIPFDAYNLFALNNRVRSYYEKSNTSYWSTNLNLTSQVGKNEVKFGGEYKYHTIKYLDMRPNTMFNFKSRTYEEQLAAFNGGTGLANYFGYGPVNENGLLTISDDFDDGVDGPKNPIIAALYLQDKVEFKDFTLNAGIRWDYLDANSWRIKDLSNITGPDGELGPEDFLDESEATSTFSPRLGLSFPVTNNTVFHAQYGKFTQLPQLEYLYNGRKNLEYWVNGAGFNATFGNPNLKPEKTTSYEIGVKQQVGDRMSVDLTAYYKETEDLIGIRKYPQLPNAVQVYDNQDYGTIRGLDLAVDLRRTNRLALNIALGIAFASGTGSDPNSASIAAWLGERQPKLTSPLDFDQRYTGVVNADYRFGKVGSDLKKGFWGDVLSQFGVNLLYTFNSGRPYSLKSNTLDPIAGGTNAGASMLSPINGVYGPWDNRMDLKIDKTFSFWKLDLNAYLYIINLFDSELVNDVWESSGLPGNTGYLNSDAGKNTILSFNNPNGTPPTTSEEYVRLYDLRSKTIANYGPPRQYRLGLRLNF